MLVHVVVLPYVSNQRLGQAIIIIYIWQYIPEKSNKISVMIDFENPRLDLIAHFAVKKRNEISVMSCLKS